MSVSTQVLYFDNLAALEAHLQAILDRCKDSADEYREILGDYLRKKQGEKDEEQWAHEISRALNASGAESDAKKDEKERKGGLFGGGKQNEKSAHAGSQKKEKGSLFGGNKPKAPTDWVKFDPFAVYVGPESKGVAELYFEAINSLDEISKKTQVALATLGTVKSKAVSAGNVSAVVSFINGIPAKMILKHAADGQRKRKKIEFSFKVPVARPALRPDLALKQ